MIKPWPEQEQMAAEAIKLLQQYGIVYFAAEERTGKTLAAILTAEQHLAPEILVVTKKKAVDGWDAMLNGYKPAKPFYVHTYTSLHKVPRRPWQLVVLDEAHSYISGAPKMSATAKAVQELVGDAAVIFISATPHAQGFHLLYHQLAMSSRSPWKKHKTFYHWFAMYGKPYTIKIQGIERPQYNKVQDEAFVKSTFEHLFITRTRKEQGFKHEPIDKLHYIELGDVTKQAYNYLVKNGVIELLKGKLVCDTRPKLRAALHMLEGGAAKIGNTYHVLANTEKVDYIKENFGDTEDCVIMYHYIAEGKKLNESFKHARILQATSYAEGVDLSMHRHLIVYSMGWSTAQHTQRRARQANKNREEEIIVHFLLVKKGISEEVYKTVAVNKKNYVDSVFEGNLL